MFYRYEIINNGKEEILYLFVTMKYEFSKEFSLNDEKDLGRRTKNFLNTNNINFKGNKVYLIVDGIVVKTLDMSKALSTPKKSDLYSCDQFMVNIKLADNSLCEITLRDYLLSILLSKYMDNIPDEVYKAMCVLFNTFSYKMMKEKHYIESDNSFALYKPASYYKTIIPSYDSIIDRLNSIITEVDCIFLTYNNQYILPFIHYSNSGKTLTNEQYPYLSSIKSLWDMSSPYYTEYNDFSYEALSKKLNYKIDSTSTINMIMKDKSKMIVLGDNIYNIEEIKNLLDLKSTDIYMIIYKNFLRIITKGWGNSYGLSVFGASEIASNGSKYYNILNYYFPKCKLLKYIKELSK